MLKFPKTLFKFHACVLCEFGPESIFKFMSPAPVDNFKICPLMVK